MTLPLTAVNGEPRSPKAVPSQPGTEAANVWSSAQISPAQQPQTTHIVEGDACPPVPLDNYLSIEGKSRVQGTLRSMAGQFAGVPGVISLAGGFPPPHLFPYAGITLRLHDGTTIDISDPAEITRAQQYNFALRGHPSLVDWITTHVDKLHAPPANQQVLVTNGGNHTLEMIAALFLDRGDTLLVEEYSYPVMTESIAQPKGLIPIGIPIDEQGIIPSGLADVLAAAAIAAKNGGAPMPKILYTVPNGQNPTGCTIPLERRRQVYALCRQYNIWIIEDDAYYYLQYNPTTPTSTPGLYGLLNSQSLPRSYLSLDVDGRVIRVDSFAKFMAPGLRLGWVTARSDVINKLTSTLHSHTVGPCSLSQSIASATLNAWGEEGLHQHLQRAQHEYSRRLSLTLTEATKELTGLAEWNAPSAGMFLWLKVLNVEDTYPVWQALAEAKVVVLPGRVMHHRAADPAFASPYLRLSYSNCSGEELVQGIQRIAEVLKTFTRQQQQQSNGGGVVVGIDVETDE